MTREVHLAQRRDLLASLLPATERRLPVIGLGTMTGNSEASIVKLCLTTDCTSRYGNRTELGNFEGD